MQLGHIGWVGDAVAIAVEVEGGGGNAKSEIVTQVTVVTSHDKSHFFELAITLVILYQKLSFCSR